MSDRWQNVTLIRLTTPIAQVQFNACGLHKTQNLTWGEGGDDDDKS